MNRKLRDAIPAELCEKCEKRIECLKDVESIPTLVKAGEDQVCIQAKPLTVMVPSSNFPWDIEVPGAVRVGADVTVEVAMKITQKELDQMISEGAEKLFALVFQSQHIEMPKKVAALRSAGSGVQHIMGMIKMITDAHKAGKTKIYLSFPETHLHPQAQLGLVDLLRHLLQEKKDGAA